MNSFSHTDRTKAVRGDHGTAAPGRCFLYELPDSSGFDCGHGRRGLFLADLADGQRRKALRTVHPRVHRPALDRDLVQPAETAR